MPIHSHEHGTKTYSKAFAIGITLNLAFVGVEIGYAIFSNSMALFADAFHNLGDVIGLALAWLAAYLAQRKPNLKYTYGLKSSTILAALGNAVLLLVAVGGIGWESIGRFYKPAPIQGSTVMIVAAIGILINASTAMLFFTDRKKDLNIQGAFLHMVADALVSVGVILGGWLIMATGWLWVDPVLSLVICAAIIWGTMGLLKDSVNLSLHGVPKGIELQKIHDFLTQQKDVTKIHDLHVWGMSTSETALTAHIEVSNPSRNELLSQLTQELEDKFGIHHVTLQMEQGNCDVHRD